MAETPLNLELLIQRPSGAPVVREYIDAAPAALAFYEGHFADGASFDAKVAELDTRFDREARIRAAEAIGVPPGGDPTRLDRFVDQGGYVVTTGQQPGLFGGPLYDVHKALTTVRLAETLEARVGKPVLPLFWIGSEDHDWAEANHTYVVGLDNQPYRPELPAPDAERHPSLHRIPLGPDIDRLVSEFLEHLPATDFSNIYFELIRESFTADATLPQAFRRVMEALLGRFGLFFTDAADPALKRASLPLLFEELERSAELEQVLTETGGRLQEAGFERQVALMEGGVNLFLDGPAGRERLYRQDEDGRVFQLHTSGETIDMDALRARVEADPSILSPNVFLRPVAESRVLPTISYVAGPGETAYYAQLKDYFAALGVRMPVIFPRFGAMAVEPKIRKVLDKFDLDIPALDRPFHELAGEIARDEVPAEVRKAIGGLRGAIGKGVGELQDAVRAVDPTLKGPAQHVRSQAFAALDDLEKKVLHALKRENEIALAQLEKAQQHLFPDGKPQERVLNPFYYLTRYGGAFLDALYDGFEVDLA